MIGAIILGIIARLAMPGRDKMGFFTTIALGLAGAVVGWLIFTGLLGIGDTQIFDLGGLLSAIIGVVILLATARSSARSTRTTPSPQAVPTVARTPGRP